MILSLPQNARSALVVVDMQEFFLAWQFCTRN